MRRELRAEVQVTVAELQEFVTRFSAASDDPFKGRLFSGVDDVSADRSILIVSSAALQENLTGCVDTWHLLWIGMDDDEKFLPGGWHQIMLLGHNKDHEFRPYGFAFATSKSCFLHRRVLECLVPPTLRCAAERHDTKIVTMSDRCKAIGAAFRESFPANPDPNLSASNPEHHTCDWHIRNHHATPKIRQLVRTSCINGVQGDRISQDIFLLSEAYTTAIFNAGVQALCHEWENKMQLVHVLQGAWSVVRTECLLSSTDCCQFAIAPPRTSFNLSTCTLYHRFIHRRCPLQVAAAGN